MATDAYDIGECIFEGGRSRVFRARRASDGCPVIVKQLRALYPPPEALERLAREFDITRAAAGPGVVEAIELLADERAVGIVTEDFGATSLASAVADSPLPVEAVLQIGHQIAVALAEIHRSNIVHRDISPANIVWNAEGGVAKLIDFGMAQVLEREAVAVGPAGAFEGTPAYCSPEQTGRMNRSVDYRSDFYSLGATLYALLTGRPPFDTRDAMALVHAHLAKTPVPAHDLDAGIPVELSDIVMVLLAKRAEDRYQSAVGLAADLQRCIDGTKGFDLRTDDIDERFHIGQELYGRDPQVATLVRSFERSVTGRGRLLLVAGYSGIGKTSLVHELHRSLAGRGAWFVEGKFDQFDRSTPYGALIRALGDLVRLVLAEDAHTVATWRTRVLDAVGGNGRVLVDVIPEIEHLLGPQPDLDDLSPSEARNRFQLVMASFVRVASSADHPLVVFLDDLQWADVASIELIAMLAGDPEGRHLLLVGAYRDNEVDAVHPLSIAVEQMTAAGALVDSIELGPLGQEDVLALVSDSVGDADGHVRLAVLCHTKTGGNPFFLKRFLYSLHDDGLLRFDAATRGWTWDLGIIQSRAATENVVDFLTREIDQLEPRAKAALENAACIGDSFDLKTLAFAQGSTRKVALDDLRGAIAAELVQPSGQGFWYADRPDEKTTNFDYRFAHDRIRQAAYASLGDDEAAAIHLRLGWALADGIDGIESDPHLFDVVEHLNRAIHLIDDVAQLDRLCDLDVAAARRATGSAAFGPAHALFEYARRCAQDADGDGWWDRSYERTLALHVEGARAAYLSGAHAAMAALVAEAMANARGVLDRVAALEVHIAALVAAQQLAAAVNTALDALELLGVSLPRDPADDDVGAAVAGTLALLDARSADDIAALPDLDDPVVAAAQRIENLVMSPAYLAVPRLLPMLAADIVQTTLAKGIGSGSPYGFAIVALVLNAGNVIDVAYRTGTIALRLLDRVDERSVRPRTMHVFYNLVKPFTDPMRELLDDQQQVFRLGIDTGDLEYAAWALHSIAANATYAGVPLAELADTTDHYLQVMEHHRQLPALACTTPFAQLLRNLRGEVADPARLVGADFDETAILADHAAADFRGAAFIVTALGLYTRYLFGEYAEAVAFADAGGHFADGATSTYHQVWWHQYRCLAVLAQVGPVGAVGPVGSTDGDTAGGDDVEAVLASLEPSLDQLRLWCSFSPANHLHRVLLLDAEIARVRGNAGEAIDLYDRSVAAAHTEGFLNEEALANELCGRFHLGRGSKTAARAYLLEACYGYTRWGATAKTAQLIDEHRSLLHGLGTTTLTGTTESLYGTARHSLSTGPPGALAHSSTADVSAELDLATLFKAANLINSENRLDKLLSRVLDVAIENAGATRGYLIIDDAETLVVGAARDAHARDLGDAGRDVTDCTGIPTGVVSYVARTGDPVVATDARTDARWAGSPGIATDRPMSILCTPIVHQDVTSGIVYLDNDLVAGAFTPARIRVLELLSSQAAISIENAQQTEELRAHRDHLEELIQERTRELDDALGELRETNAVLDKLSLTDALTGLPNRRHFDQSIDVEWARAHRDRSSFGVMMIDVDWFKPYNDHYGHQQGDECLRQIATALLSVLKRPGDLVARYGGEEFAAILPGVDTAGARRVGDAMLEAVRSLQIEHAESPDTGRDADAGDDPGHVTISIGVAVTVPDGPDPSTVVKLADENLYRAKEAGRDQLVEV